jgi:DNA-binding beta-propeller fold protein YncE
LANEAVNGIALMPDDNTLLALQPSRLLVYPIDRNRPPSIWTAVSVATPTAAAHESAAVSPDGKYVFLAGEPGLFLAEISPGQPPSTWTFRKISEQNPVSILATSDGRFLIGLGRGAGAQRTGVWVMEIATGRPPEQWPVTNLPYPTVAGIRISPDSRYVFLNGNDGTVAAIDLLQAPRPAQWQIVPFLQLPKLPGICVSPDSQFGFAVIGGMPGERPSMLTMFGIVPGTSPTKWPTHQVDASDDFSPPFAAIAPSGAQVVAPQAYRGALCGWRPTPPLTAS